MSDEVFAASASLRFDDFDAFRAEVVAIVSQLDALVGHDAELDIFTALGEADQTLRLVERSLRPGDVRLLEVGSGLGLASLFLERCGFEICSVEPAAVGFDWHRTAAARLYDALGGTHVHVAGQATDLPASLGTFDLIFSNNVVEHIDDPGRTLTFLSDRLSDGGVMLHSCPNYSFPYEPHFGVPLVPFRPQWSERVLPASITETALWDSLNFITERQVREWAAGTNMHVTFATGQLADSVERLTTDREFAGRHPQLTRLAGILVRVGATRLLRRMPASVSTPMEFTLSRALTEGPAS